jgi:hypothetical protein
MSDGGAAMPDVAVEAKKLEEMKDELGGIRQSLVELAASLKKSEERQAEAFAMEDDLEERLSRVTDTDLVYMAHEAENLVFGQARDGYMPAPGALVLQRRTLVEMTLRFVPKAVIERVDRIFEDKAEMDCAEGRFLREVLSDHGGNDA